MTPRPPVHVIDIDEAALDLYGQWPWPRSYMAALTDRLFAHGAAAVGYDVLFPEPDRTSPERIVESWSRFAQGIPPALPDLGLVPHDARFAEAVTGARRGAEPRRRPRGGRCPNPRRAWRSRAVCPTA